MPDQYESVRSLPFPALASALGLDLQRFKRKGDEWVGPCPYHKPKNNVGCFRYHDDGRFNCFVCLKGFSGRGAIDFCKAMQVCGFQQAVDFLRPFATSEPPKQKNAPESVSDATAAIVKPLGNDTWSKFKVPCPWLEARCPDQAIREKYGVFCYNNPPRRSAYSGRVMIPIKDESGILYGYLGRSTQNGSEPKYLFPKDFPKSRFLFEAYELRQHLADMKLPASSRYKEIYLVESPFAVMKFASLAIPALALYGWSVSNEQLEQLVQLAKGCVYLPDRNKADSTHHVVTALAQRLWLRFPPLPAGVDDPEQLQTKDQILAL